MYDKIHEPITVTAAFAPGKRPVIHSLEWKGKVHQVREVTLATKARKGREVVWLFNVVTENMAFKLRLDTDTLSWWLEELTWDNITV